MIYLVMYKINQVQSSTFNRISDNEISINSSLKSKESFKRKVDINVLKSRAKNIQDKENRKNVLIFGLVLALLGFVGIYLSI